MNSKVGCLMAILLLAGCAKQTPPPQANNGWLKKTPQGNSLNVAKSSAGSTTVAYSDVIKQAASHYGVDETLIKAIIQVESGYNPDVVSRSNAVGLMQIKASTAGRDAYR